MGDLDCNEDPAIGGIEDPAIGAAATMAKEFMHVLQSVVMNRHHVGAASLIFATVLAACGGKTDDSPHATGRTTTDAGGACCVVDGSAYCQPTYSIEMPNPLSTTLPCDIGAPCSAYESPAPNVWVDIGDVGVCEPQ